MRTPSLPPSLVPALGGALSLLAVVVACGGEEKAPGGAPSAPSTSVDAGAGPSVFALLAIDSVAEGLARTDLPTEVHFKSYQADSGQVGVPLGKRIFTFDPPVDGVTRWTSRTTLSFKPHDGFTAGQRYRVTVDLAALMPTEKDAGTFTYSLEVAPRDLVSFQGAFEAEPGGSLGLRGEVVLTDDVDLKELRRAVTLREAEGGPVPLPTWKQTETGYVFRAPGFSRGQKARRFLLRFDGQAIGVARTQEVAIDLPAASEFAVVSAGYEGAGDDAVYRINLNADIAPQQKVAEFITVSPPLDVKVSSVGRRITVGGAFALGTEYTVTMKAGLKSTLGTAIDKQHVQSFTASDLVPHVEFSQGGVFLTSGSDARIAFRTTNVRRVRVTLMEVFANNLGQFLQSSDLRAGRAERAYFNLHPVGKERFSQTLELAAERNVTAQHELDLAKAIAGRDGIFIVQLSFQNEDLAFKCKKNQAGAKAEEATTEEDGVWYWNGPDSYDQNPCRYSFWYERGTVARPVVVSDLGLVTKTTEDGLWAFTTDLMTGAPRAGVEVAAYTYQLQEVGRATTDAQGLARLPASSDPVFYVEARRGKHRTALKPAEGGLNLSTFSVGGTSRSRGLSTFTYTERGVYRPGDPIHLTAILRNRDQTFPTDHPVEVRLFTPKGKEHSRATLKEGKDGVYAFPLRTDETDPTGSWGARVYVAGEDVAWHPLRIETVVPPRLKLKLKPAEEQLSGARPVAHLGVASTYLFGAPAADLRAEVKASLAPRRRSFAQHRGFLFDATSVSFARIEQDVFDDHLDEEGQAEVSWSLPSLARAPSDLTLTWEAKVYEKGGRFVVERTVVPIEPWTHYVGIRLPQGQARVKESTELEVMVVDRDGKPVPGRKLSVNVYSNQHRWWWQRTDDYHERFKSDLDTRPILQTEIVSGSTATKVKFRPEEYGELLFEVKDTEGGHVASALMWTYGWHRPQPDGRSASLLTVTADQAAYQDGQVAHLTFPVPGPSRALITLESGGVVHHHVWKELTTTQADVEVPLKSDYGPNVYAFVHLFQPWATSENDHPLRSYGVIDLPIEDARRKLDISVKVPDEILPRSSFSIRLKNADRRDAQVTVAVVDEGLLDITHFKTPDPGGFFYAKQGIGVATADMYDQVIGATWGDVKTRFAIGGDGAEEGEGRKQVNPVKARRFEPVSLFQGPLALKAGETRDVSFEMPNYNGSVRVMVVAAHRGAYASVEETVPVRAPIVLLPTLPRVAGPGDRFDMPVSVFGLKDDVGTVEVSLKVSGPLSIEGTARHKVTFKALGEQEVMFRLVGKEAMGVGKVEVTARSPRYQASWSTELAVRPASAVTSDHLDDVLKANQTLRFKIPKEGLDGSRKAELIVSTLPDLGFSSRAGQLIGYPHGCLEQTTSRAFPQLYLREIFPDLFRADEIDRNVNAALDKLQAYQGRDGGFYYWTYWDYHRYPYHDWGTSWVGHFMVEARKKGYFVSERMYERWLTYQRSHATVSPHVVNLYRLYTLALAGDPQVSLMNRVRERWGDEMSGTQLLLLAGAYQAAGLPGIASGLLALHQTAKPQLEPGSAAYYDYYWRYSFGSHLRDTAIELQVQTALGMETEAFTTYKQIAQKLTAHHWYDTHAVAWTLLAVGQFIEKFDLKNARIKLDVDLPSGTRVVSSGANSVSIDVTEHIGKEITLTSRTEGTLFASVAYDYLPLRPDAEPLSDNLAMTVTYRDEDGDVIDPRELAQGTSFWAIYRIASTSEVPIENVALTQILPAGWEIENTRLTGEAPPEWLTRGFYVGGEDYVDLRDDRISWFFNVQPRGYRYPNHHDGMAFAVKVNTVGTGEFEAAPAFAEAMYDASYRARIPGMRVKVVRPQ